MSFCCGLESKRSGVRRRKGRLLALVPCSRKLEKKEYANENRYWVVLS